MKQLRKNIRQRRIFYVPEEHISLIGYLVEYLLLATLIQGTMRR